MRSDERAVIKSRGKKKKRQNLGLCDELRWAVVMMVTHLSPSVLLPGTVSAMTPKSQWMEVPTAKGRSRSAESSLHEQWKQGSPWDIGMWQEMPIGSAEFSVSGQHFRICRMSSALSQESRMQNEQEQNSNFSLKF